MKVLPAGTRRYLYVNPAEIERNFQRRGARGPVAHVAERDEDGVLRVHTGYGIQADGPVALAYDPVGSLAHWPDQYRGGRRVPVRAAYVTEGRVAIAETSEEAESLMLQSITAPEVVAEIGPEPDAPTTTIPTAPEADVAPEAKRPSQKKPTVKKTEEKSK